MYKVQTMESLNNKVGKIVKENYGRKEKSRKIKN